MIQTASIAILLVILGIVQSQNNICYTKCAEGFCADDNSLACTACDEQFLQINQQCIPTRGQSEPIEMFAIRGQNSLLNIGDKSGNYTQVICNIGTPQNSTMIFFDLTVSETGIYFSNAFQFKIPQTHEYIQIKMNAILFNRRDNPSIDLLIVDQFDQDLVNNKIEANILDQNRNNSVTCLRNGENPINSSYPFFINQKLSGSSKQIFVQIITRQTKDFLGVSNFELYYGNCHPTCEKCFGAGSKECLSCRNFLKFNSSTNSCDQCPSGLYRLQDICLSCPLNCKTCKFDGNKGYAVCTTCVQGLNKTDVPDCLSYNQQFVNLNEITFSSAQGWQSSQVLGNIVSTCGRYSIAGGLPNGLGGSTISKQFTNLNAHRQIWIKFTIMTIDQQAAVPYQVTIAVDNQTIESRNLIVSKTEQNNTQCGVQLFQYIFPDIVVNKIAHSRNAVRISITGSSNYFGIRDFVLGVVNQTTDPNCIRINNQGACTQCNNGLILSEGQCRGCPSRHYFKEGRCINCPIFCNQCQLVNNVPKCINCDEPLTFNQENQQCLDSTNSIYTLSISPKASNITTSGWNFYPRLQTKGQDKCGQDFILGSSQIKYRGIKLNKLYQNLPGHQGAIIHFMFYQIDDYNAGPQNLNTVVFKIDDRAYNYPISSQGYQKCGNSSLDQVHKITLKHDQHVNPQLNFAIQGNAVKFGINQIIIFLSNCPQCANNLLNYEVETIPVYRIQQQNLSSLKTKIIFNDQVKVLTNQTDNLFRFSISEREQTADQTVVAQATGNLGETNQLIGTFIKQSRELIGERPLFRNYNNSNYTVSPIAPDNIFSNNPENTLVKPIKLRETDNQLPTYTFIDDEGNKTGMRNLRNFFRGIAVLGMWIGMISFLFGLSSAFDDLFILTQVIFAHIFIQSAWLAPTFKVPVSGMQFVQFMAWLPDAARNGIEAGIIPSNHYQRSPIIYEQYYKDITFARTIYHTVLFIIALIALYLIIRMVQALTRPTIGQILDVRKKDNRKIGFLRKFYFDIRNHPFVCLDKGMRFCYFTVIWACVLQFTWFQNLPFGFFQWNAALCIIFFIVFVLYPILGFIYLRKQYGISSTQTFNQLYGGIRVRGERLLYFPFKYIKLIAIALLIGLLYKVNPLATLIPLMVLHLLDAVILFVFKPYHLKEYKNRILSWFGRNYWTYYRWSHIIQNILFFILELILVIMYARRNLDSKDSYFSIGYAASVFVIFLLINGLIRVAWTLIRYFESCFYDYQSEHVRIQSQDNDIPINQVRNMNPQTTRTLIDPRNDGRKPSIENSVANQFRQ